MSFFETYFGSIRDFYLEPSICIRRFVILVFQIVFLVLFWNAVRPFAETSKWVWFPLVIISCLFFVSILVGIFTILGWFLPEKPGIDGKFIPEIDMRN